MDKLNVSFSMAGALLERFLDYKEQHASLKPSDAQCAQALVVEGLRAADPPRRCDKKKGGK